LKTSNRATFSPIFDDVGSFTLCCVVIDPRDSNIVWLGHGRITSQRSAFGDGIYKSTDAGKTADGAVSSEHGKIADPRSRMSGVAAQGLPSSRLGDRASGDD
jgi:hypothetical protein